MEEIVGTSPRTRGKPRVPPGLIRSARNIPAHAGKTEGQLYHEVAATEHPRARGENNPFMPAPKKRLGTSPRTRGKRYPRKNPQTRRGNIPAHAGKTVAALVNAPCFAEHPRARGENAPARRLKVIDRGTSPRTRGKPIAEHYLQQKGRNIPAHAGKTCYGGTSTRRHEEHPRARGKTRSVSGRKAASRQHPRARGENPGCGRPRKTTRRNIPAHAGKTQLRRPLAPLSAEHPRARGENNTTHDCGPVEGGTSPRTRGKRAFDILVYRMLPEHPRARGENSTGN